MWYRKHWQVVSYRLLIPFDFLDKHCGFSLFLFQSGSATVFYGLCLCGVHFLWPVGVVSCGLPVLSC